MKRHYVETQEWDWLIDPETDKKIKRVPILRVTSCNSYEDAIDFVRDVNLGRSDAKDARYLGAFHPILKLHPDLSHKEKPRIKQNEKPKTATSSIPAEQLRD